VPLSGTQKGVQSIRHVKKKKSSYRKRAEGEIGKLHWEKQGEVKIATEKICRAELIGQEAGLS